MAKKNSKHPVSTLSPKSSVFGAMRGVALLGVLFAVGYLYITQSMSQQPTLQSENPIKLVGDVTPTAASGIEPYSIQCGNSALWKHEGGSNLSENKGAVWGSYRPGIYFGKVRLVDVII